MLLFIYSLGEVRYEELSVLVNVKSKPTIVSAGFEKNLAGDAWPGPLLPGVGRVCACDLGGLLGSDGPRVGAELIDVRQLSQPRYWSLVCGRKLCRLATEIVFCMCCSQTEMVHVDT